MYKVVVAPNAWDEFFEIFDFISRDKPDAAADFCDALLSHVEILATFPHLGLKTPNRADVRSVLHTPVRIYYRLDEIRERVEVIHFWHTARQQPRV